MRQKASKNGLKRPKAMNQVSKGLMGSLSTPKVKDVVIGPGKPKRLSKNPWECKIRMGQVGVCQFFFGRFSKCWPTETKIFGLWNSQPKLIEVIGIQSVSVGFRFWWVFSVSLSFIFQESKQRKKKLKKKNN